MGDALLKMRGAIAAVSRRLPAFRGLGRGWRLVNRWFLKLGAAPVVDARMRDGTLLRVDLRTRTESGAYYRGEYEDPLIQTVQDLYDCDTDFLDIGANIGFYSVAMAACIKRQNGAGRIWSFEPFAGNCARLRENLALNDLTELCRVFEFGLSNRDRDETLTLREDFELGAGTGNASLAINVQFDRGFTTARVPLRTLDSVITEITGTGPTIGFVKMDIEGHEDRCLEGAVDTLSAHRPIILMEVNKPYYQARGVDPDTQILRFIPPEYMIFRYRGSGWGRIRSLRACTSIDNIFLVPAACLHLDRFREIFGTSGGGR
ncbi:MAG: FkbM family methyltransferase [Gammaproteobacteria bacterium]|nr:FkbM family methyltransferase [Gammaproteobacteria bacterium]